MKPHLPIAILATLLSSFSISSVQAVDIPSDYEQVDLWTPGYLDDYTASDAAAKCAFILWSDTVFTPQTNTTWTDSQALVTGREHIFTTAEGYTPAALSFTAGASTVFEQPTSLVFDTLSHLNISNQTGSNSGGAIDLGTGGTLSIKNVSDGNKETADVTFSGNVISSKSALYGGAIHANATDSTIDISDNCEVRFYANAATPSADAGGGAIYSTGTLLIKNNSVYTTFIENHASSIADGTYKDRHSSGGAIYSTGNVDISENSGDIIFSQNYAFSAYGGSKYYYTEMYPGIISGGGYHYFDTYAYGGAIYSTDNITIRNNTGDLVMHSNYVQASAAYDYNIHAYGGAIYSSGTLSITGNSSVIFEKNYEKTTTSNSNPTYTYRLRSIYLAPNSSEDSLIIAAKTGGHIIFHDSVYMLFCSGATVSFNADYQDADGVTQKAGGDIIFSGKFTAEHLEAVKNSAATAAEITNSQTSAIDNHINLYGGSLQVVDGAKLNGRGLTVAEGSSAKLLLRDGSMSHSYTFTFNTSGTLELQGVNTINASKLIMGADSSLTVILDETHLTNAALTLGGTDLETSKLTVNLNRTDGLTSGVYKIISQASASDFTTSSAWTAANVCVNGSGGASQAAFEDLVWEGGTLYYKVGRTTWGNASGDGLWNSTSDNWTMNDRSYTYQDGMDVSFTDTAAGTVMLDGDIAAADILVNNSEGNDYTFSTTNGGKLTGTGGITKQGTGALTIATANEHTGDTSLEGGTLNLHHSTALGATATGDAALTTAAGTSMNIAANSHLVLAGSNSMAGEVAVEAGSTLEMKGSGYAASTSTVNGTLAFTGTAAATNAAGSLSGTGSVQVTDSAVSFASQSGFTGNLGVSGKSAALSIASGNYTGAGQINVEGGTLTFGATANLTLNSGGALKLEAMDDTPAELSLNNLNVKSGATLLAQAELQDAVSLNVDDVVGYAGPTVNSAVGGVLDCTRVTLNMGSTLALDNAHFDMNGGTLTLAVPASASGRIELVLSFDAVYTMESQVMLFSNLGTINFIYDGVTADVSQGSTYSLNAADYFSGKGITANTELVFDGGRNVLYLQGMEMVPEPTTATLSLLALAALAARRRRK